MMTTVTCVCPLCGAITHVTCDADAYTKYAYTHALIQDVFPNMDIHTRETLISGMCEPCQIRFFTDDEDEEEEEDPYEGCFECDNIECPLAK